MTEAAARKYGIEEEKSCGCIVPSRQICTPPEGLELMRKYLTARSAKNGTKTAGDIVKQLEKILGVDSEIGIWEHPQFREFVGVGADRILERAFKATGPALGVDLLDNYNIDETLHGWEVNSVEMFGRHFHHIPYQTIDFATTGGELAKLDLAQLVADGFDCFGCVINTDTSEPGHRGKHWFCIFGDLAHAGSRADPYRLEFFNSSGNPPKDEMEIWFAALRHQTAKQDRHLKIIRSAPRRIQYSNTECGVFCLIYILSRLKGNPPDFFYQISATDNDMISLRAFLFRNCSRSAQKNK